MPRNSPNTAFRFSSEEKAELQELARRLGVTQAGAVRELVHAALQTLRRIDRRLGAPRHDHRVRISIGYLENEHDV